MKKKFTLLLAMLFVSCISFAQLPGFTFTVTPTPQTCLGNGSLTFSVSGTQPGATIGYEVYLLPNTTTPVATTNNSTVTSLVAGTYMVIATQNLGGESSSETGNAVITNDGSNLAYTLVPQNVRCGEDGVITVNVTTGIGVSYEIIEGPETFPPQASNVFSGLSVGQYQVRVQDDCGNAIVTTIQLTQVVTDIIIGDAEFDEGELPSCNSIMVEHFYGGVTGNTIFFPLEFEYTVYPPGGGAPTVVTANVASGSDIANTIATQIPFYEGQEYTYDLVITDVCGNTFEAEDNIVDNSFFAELVPGTESCGNFFLKIIPHFYVAPYTVEFLSTPAGFNASVANPSHPSFSDISAIYGSDTNPIPVGTYEVKITDDCGNSFIEEIEILDEAEITSLSSINQLNCLGQLGMSISGGREFDTVTIIDAPDAYPNPLPADVSGFIAGSEFTMGNLPLGTYTFEIIDNCGTVYTEVVDIMPSQLDLMLNKTQRPGCDVGVGSIRLSTSSGNPLVSVIITSAPASFGETLPYDVSFNVVGGTFYMNSLPEGIYTFETLDNCGSERNEAITILGYHVITNDVEIIANCGSFDIDLAFDSNGSYVQSFWLQEYNSVTDTWGHPLTGVPYIEGNLPANGNSVFLNNNQVNLNLAYTGQFRIVRAFHTFSNGNPLNNRCIEVIEEFTFDGAPAIIAAYSFPCNNNTSEVIIDAVGIDPLTYEITTMDGDPFPVDNGTSNLFSGLEAGTYNFRVTDVCGSFVNIQIDISVLEPIVIEAQGFCDGQDSSLSVQDFSFLTYEWYEQGSPGTILSTSNELSFPSFDPSTDTGTYVVSITSSSAGSCINQEIVYVVVPTDSPEAGEDNEIALCNDGTPLDLADYLSEGHDEGGTWEDVDTTGALTGSMLATAGLPGGTYTFEYSVASLCGVTDTAAITVVLTSIPAMPVVEEVNDLCEGSDIQLSATAVAGGTYEWNGPDGFTSDEQNPLIENATVAASGTYTLMVTVNDCVSPVASVEVDVQSAANAGEDATALICNDGSVIALEDYLDEEHDNGGTWTDLDGTGALVGGTLDLDGLEAGTYQFAYTVVNACNSTDEATLTITLNDIPATPDVSVSGPVCEGGDVQLSATQVTGAVYLWTGPDNFTSDEQNPLIDGATPSASGTYSLVVTVNGCASPSVSVNAVVNPAPQFTLEGDDALCEGQTGVIMIVPSNFDADSAGYEWYYNGELLEDVTAATIEITENGTYEVIVDANGCTASSEFVVSANSNAFEVVLENGCVNYDYIIEVVNFEEITGATVSWTGPEGFMATGPSATITGLGSGDYVATVTNDEGCSVIAAVTVDNTACFIPRGISPNGDGDNDSFDISNLDVKNIKIFNRYGMQVYEKENYKDEWHGQSGKGDLPTGTYFYMITLSAGKQITGWVYLQREL